MSTVFMKILYLFWFIFVFDYILLWGGNQIAYYLYKLCALTNRSHKF